MTIPRKNVSLIVPPNNIKYIIRDYAGGLGFEACNSVSDAYVLPPLDILQLATIISDKYNASIIDAQIEGISGSETIEKLERLQPEIVIVEISIPTLLEDIEFCKSLNKINAVIYGKIYTHEPTILNKILSTKVFRACLTSEAEDNILEILSDQDSRNTATFADGVVKIHDKSTVEDLNTLPKVDWTFVKGASYFYPKLGECATLLSSKGCPFPCSYYCPYPLVQGKKWRAKSAEYVIEEIKDAVRQGYERFLFRDPLFTINKNRVLSICKKIIKQGLEIRWWCETRADCLNEVLIDAMATSGCIGINIGVESGDTKIRLSQLKGGVTNEQLVKVCSWGRKHNIHIAFLLMVGFPGESRSSILATARLLSACRPQSVGLNFPVPYWGTDLYNDALENDWLVDLKPEHRDGATPLLLTEHLTYSEMIEGREFLECLFESIQSENYEQEAEILENIKCWSK